MYTKRSILTVWSSNSLDQRVCSPSLVRAVSTCRWFIRFYYSCTIWKPQKSSNDVWARRAINSVRPEAPLLPKKNNIWPVWSHVIEENVGTAVDKCRHSTTVHVADEWIRLQFFQVCFTSRTALRYTGCLKVTHCVQQRQWSIRKQHEDGHYAPCLFLAWKRVCSASCVLMTSTESKSESLISTPVASAERGRQVIQLDFHRLSLRNWITCRI